MTETSMLRTFMFPYRGVFEFSFAYDYLNSNKMDAVIVRLGMIYGENDQNYRFRPLIEQFAQSREITLSKPMGNWIASKGYVKVIVQL